jgi:hypothetical protein
MAPGKKSGTHSLGAQVYIEKGVKCDARSSYSHNVAFMLQPI